MTKRYPRDFYRTWWMWVLNLPSPSVDYYAALNGGQKSPESRPETPADPNLGVQTPITAPESLRVGSRTAVRLVDDGADDGTYLVTVVPR